MPSSTRIKNSASGTGKRFPSKIGFIFALSLLVPLLIWIFGIIWFSGPLPRAGNVFLAIVWAVSVVLVPLALENRKISAAFIAGACLLVVLPYLFVQPSHDRDWAVPFAKTASAEVEGNQVVFQNFRTFDYRPDGKPIPAWSTRTFDLENIRGMDFFISHWGVDYIGHPIFSFDLGEQGHIAFTIEARMEKNEAYSILAGLYKNYELLYIPCEESDAVRVRTSFRENESVYLYRTVATPEQARARFLEFVETMNRISLHPRFYNVISSNCTTAVRSQMTGGFPFDWRIIANGKLDEMLYDRGLLKKSGLTFDELKSKSHINPKVVKNSGTKDFSSRIRQGVPGFEERKKGRSVTDRPSQNN